MMNKTLEPLVPYTKSWENYTSVPIHVTKSEKAQGIQTLGWGTTFLNNSAPATCTGAQAMKWLTDRIQSNFDLLRPYVFQNDWQRNACVSLAYNTGFGEFPRLLAFVKEGDFNSAYMEFFNCIYQKDPSTKKLMPLSNLIYRRACDAQIFKYGIYERRLRITPAEKELFLSMNTSHTETITMLNNKIVVA